MKLLKVTETEFPGLGDSFEEVEKIPVSQLAPEVVDGDSNARMNGTTVRDYDAAFLEIPLQNPVFGRVLMEMVEESGLNLNYASTAFFIMAKKNYLSYVLHQKSVESPKNVCAASPKASRNVGKYLEFPIVARRFDDLRESESTLLESQEELDEFTEGIEYGDDLVIFRERVKGDKYRVFYCDDSIVSLEDRTDGWKHSREKLHYSNISNELSEEVKRCMRAIGTDYGEALVKGGSVVDVNPNPDLETYREVSGKDVVEATEEMLKGEKG